METNDIIRALKEQIDAAEATKKAVVEKIDKKISAFRDCIDALTGITDKTVPFAAKSDIVVARKETHMRDQSKKEVLHIEKRALQAKEIRISRHDDVYDAIIKLLSEQGPQSSQDIADFIQQKFPDKGNDKAFIPNRIFTLKQKEKIKRIGKNVYALMSYQETESNESFTKQDIDKMPVRETQAFPEFHDEELNEPKDGSYYDPKKDGNLIF